jgi:hypothetical protein
VVVAVELTRIYPSSLRRNGSPGAKAATGGTVQNEDHVGVIHPPGVRGRLGRLPRLPWEC